VTRYPTITDVIVYLRASGQLAMALAVERLQNNYERLKEASEHNVEAYQRLQTKYEPRPRQAPGPTWTGD
jgi:hypothetical protein